MRKTPDQMIEEWWERQELETKFEPQPTQFGIAMAVASEAVSMHIETQAQIACVLERISAALDKLADDKVLS